MKAPRTPGKSESIVGGTQRELSTVDYALAGAGTVTSRASVRAELAAAQAADELLVVLLGAPCERCMRASTQWRKRGATWRTRACLKEVKYGVLTLSERISDQDEMNKHGEHHGEFLEPGTYPAEALEKAKQPLDFVAPLVDRIAVMPSGDTGGLGRHDRRKSQVEGQLRGFVTFVGPIHDQMHRAVGAAQVRKQLATFGRIMRLAHQ